MNSRGDFRGTFRSTRFHNMPFVPFVVHEGLL